MKKSLIIYSLFSIPLLFASCEKDKIEAPDFNVTVDSDTFKVGKEITFHFSGKAESIVFWSGERGKVYANRQRTVEKGTTQTLQFTTLAGAGSINNSLSVLASINFKGAYTAEGISQATWTDITSRAILSSNATAAAGTSTASGAINITDLADAENTPVYFAFRYLSPASATLAPRAWTVSTFAVSNTLADGTANAVVANLAGAGFKAVDVKNPAAVWALTPNITSPTAMNLPGATIDAARAENEDWVISAPIKLNTVLAVDYGLSVASLSTLSPPKTFSYTFAAAGTYKVVFHAYNSSLEETKSIVRELTLTITP